MLTDYADNVSLKLLEAYPDMKVVNALRSGNDMIEKPKDKLLAEVMVSQSPMERNPYSFLGNYIGQHVLVNADMRIRVSAPYTFKTLADVIERCEEIMEWLYGKSFVGSFLRLNLEAMEIDAASVVSNSAEVTWSQPVFLTKPAPEVNLGTVKSWMLNPHYYYTL